MLDLDIDVKGAAEFQRAIESLQRECGKSAPAAVKLGASRFLRSASAATREAKQYPEIVQTIESSGITGWSRAYWRAVDDIHGGYKMRKYPVKKYGKREVQHMERRKFAGLAKKVWGLAKAKSGSGHFSSGGKCKIPGSVNVGVRKKLSDSNPSIQISNGLSYAVEAMNGDVGSILEKAANQVKGYIERKIQAHK